MRSSSSATIRRQTPALRIPPLRSGATACPGLMTPRTVLPGITLLGLPECPAGTPSRAKTDPPIPGVRPEPKSINDPSVPLDLLVIRIDETCCQQQTRPA